MQPPKYLPIITTLLGLFFLLSGFGKELDIAEFTRTIGAYGLPQLAPLAPVLIALEVGLGIALLLRVHLKKLALLSLGLLGTLTALFAYGYVVHGITSCGCFGALEALQMPSWLSFVRNVVLMGVTVWLYRYAPTTSPPAVRIRFRIALAAAVLAFIISGSAYANRYSSSKVGVVRGQLLRASLLAPYLPVASDSTYVVFVFSPSCSHCEDITPTVISYRTSGIAARIIALHPPIAAAEQQRYVQRFNPPFYLRTVARDSLYAITYQVPLAIVVRRGMVAQVLGPAMPSAAVLKGLLDKDIAQSSTLPKGK
jgi:Methylamine utilisation protein MauE